MKTKTTKPIRPGKNLAELRKLNLPPEEMSIDDSLSFE